MIDYDSLYGASFERWNKALREWIRKRDGDPDEIVIAPRTADYDSDEAVTERMRDRMPERENRLAPYRTHKEI